MQIGNYLVKYPKRFGYGLCRIRGFRLETMFERQVQSK